MNVCKCYIDIFKFNNFNYVYFAVAWQLICLHMSLHIADAFNFVVDIVILCYRTSPNST